MVKKVKRRKKIPMRTCAGCGESKPKKDLLRIVRTPERVVAVDRSGRMNGRGTYVCYCEGCTDAAIKGRRFEHVLDVEIDPEDLSRLKKEILSAVEDIINAD